MAIHELNIVENCWGGKRELADNTILAKQAFAISLLTLHLLPTRAIISNSNCLTIVPYWENTSDYRH